MPKKVSHIDKWIMLLKEEACAGYMGDVLQYDWHNSAPPGLRYTEYSRRVARRVYRKGVELGAMSKNTPVYINSAELFEQWLRAHRPALIAQFERADAIVRLSSKSDEIELVSVTQFLHDSVLITRSAAEFDKMSRSRFFVYKHKKHA